jgi:hypothetical protein
MCISEASCYGTIMSLDASPKKFGEDVAEGLQIISRATLKKYTPADIQKILGGLEVVAREIRSTAVDSGDYEGLKLKGMKTQRVNSAMLVIRTFQKEQRRLGGDPSKPPLSAR